MEYDVWAPRMGAVIRRHRLDASMTQEELAHKAASQPIRISRGNINQSDISRIESGKQGYEIDTIYRIAQALERPLSASIAEAEDSTSRPYLTAAAISLAEKFSKLPAADKKRYSEVMKLITMPTSMQTKPPSGAKQPAGVAETPARYTVKSKSKPKA